MKKSVSYMTVTTAMLVWNYFSYFWGGASACWGNGQFVREPLDLTILFLSESTVKTHIYNIFRKLEVKNRIEAIRIVSGD